MKSYVSRVPRMANFFCSEAASARGGIAALPVPLPESVGRSGPRPPRPPARSACESSSAMTWTRTAPPGTSTSTDPCAGRSRRGRRPRRQRFRFRTTGSRRRRVRAPAWPPGRAPTDSHQLDVDAVREHRRVEPGLRGSRSTVPRSISVRQTRCGLPTSTATPAKDRPADPRRRLGTQPRRAHLDGHVAVEPARRRPASRHGSRRPGVPAGTQPASTR